MPEGQFPNKRKQNLWRIKKFKKRIQNVQWQTKNALDENVTDKNEAQMYQKINDKSQYGEHSLQ